MTRRLYVIFSFLALSASVAAQETPRLRGKTAFEWGKQLQAKDEKLRIQAVEALVEMGKDAKSAGSALVGALRDSNPAVHEKASDALAKIGKEAVPALLPALQSAHDEARIRAIKILGNMGAEAKSALPALNAILKAKSVPVREQAADAIDKINDITVTRVKGSRIGDFTGTWSGKGQNILLPTAFPNAQMTITIDAHGKGSIDSRPGGDSNIDLNKRFSLVIKTVKDGKVTLPGGAELRLNREGTILSVQMGRGVDQITYQLKKQ